MLSINNNHNNLIDIHTYWYTFHITFITFITRRSPSYRRWSLGLPPVQWVTVVSWCVSLWCKKQQPMFGSGNREPASNVSNGALGPDLLKQLVSSYPSRLLLASFWCYLLILMTSCLTTPSRGPFDHVVNQCSSLIDILFCMFCGSRLLFWGHQNDNTEPRCRTIMFIWAAQPGCMNRIFQTWVCTIKPQGFPRSKDWMHFCNSISSGCAARSSACFFCSRNFKNEIKKDKKTLIWKHILYPIQLCVFFEVNMVNRARSEPFHFFLISPGHLIHLDGFNPECFQEWW